MTQTLTRQLRKARQNRTVYLMLLPGLFFLAVFAVYPILWILRMMFYQYTSFGDMRFTGLSNFKQLFQDALFANALRNTAVYAFFKLIITLPISFLLAYLVNMKLRGRMFYRTMFFMPTIISVSVMSTVFYLIFNPYNGSLNKLLLACGLVSDPVNWFGTQHAMTTVLMIAVWGAVGNYMIYFLSGLQTIPTEVYESAELDGAVGFKRLWHITLPMMAPITQMVIMLALIQAFKDYENILVLTAGGPNNRTEVLYLYIYRLMFPMGDSYGNAVLNYGYGATVAFATAVIVGLVTLLYLRWSRKMDETF